MTNPNPRNYHKNPHTARWLMTFHAAAQRAGVAGEADLDEEQSAKAFVSGGRSTAPERKEIFIKGWRILTGPGLVSEAQAKWIVDIAEKSEGITDAMVKSLAERLTQGFARAAATEFISKYKDLPKRATVAQFQAGHVAPSETAPKTVEAGRYALVHETGIKFYRVTEGKGRWAGRTFVEAQASDEYHPIRNPESRQAILAAIAEAPHEAMVRYGHELGVCGRCGRTLTDDASRAAGIGPVCANKY